MKQIFQTSSKSQRKWGCDALGLSFKMSSDELKWTQHYSLGKPEPIPEKTVDMDDGDVY